MSTEARATRDVPCRTLGQYVSLLLSRLGEAEPRALARIREIVGDRRARIALDDESVDVRFDGATLVVVPDAGGAGPLPGGAGITGSGATSRAVTLDLLDGFREVTAAVLDGDLELTGTVEDVAAMGQAIEVLLDASVRVPGLQRLARDYREDPCRPPRAPGAPVPRRTPFYPDRPADDELELLRRLDLLP